MTITVKYRANRHAAPVPMGVVAMAGAVLLLVVGRVVSLLDSRDPWLNEAMLALNFLNGADGTPLSVLPYFDQVTTPLYAVIFRLAARLPESAQIDALRAVAAIVSLIAAFFLYRAARRVGDGITPILAPVIAFATPLALCFSTELKHYAFDMLATAVVAWLAVRFIERCSRARLAGLAIGSIAIMPASFMLISLIPFRSPATNTEIAQAPNDRFGGLSAAPALSEIRLYVRFFAIDKSNIRPQTNLHSNAVSAYRARVRWSALTKASKC